MEREKRDAFPYAKISISSADELLFECAVQGHGNRNWYVTRLRHNDTLELIYVFLSGSGAFLNDFKIIGKKDDGTIGILLDFDELKQFGDVGGHFNLFVDDFSKQPTLRLHGDSGNFSLRWNGATFEKDIIYSLK